MREIKFRAWDKDCNIMLNIKKINFYKNLAWFDKTNLPFNHPLSKGVGSCIHLNFDVELMQYTGLKDKNGTEIYEGDIIYHWRNQFGEGYHPVYSEVYFENGSFWCRSLMNIEGFLEPHSGDFEISRYDYAEISEVVGNIYDNKKLKRCCVTHLAGLKDELTPQTEYINWWNSNFKRKKLTGRCVRYWRTEGLLGKAIMKGKIAYLSKEDESKIRAIMYYTSRLSLKEVKKIFKKNYKKRN